MFCREKKKRRMVEETGSGFKDGTDARGESNAPFCNTEHLCDHRTIHQQPHMQTKPQRMPSRTTDAIPHFMYLQTSSTDVKTGGEFLPISTPNSKPSRLLIGTWPSQSAIHAVPKIRKNKINPDKDADCSFKMNWLFLERLIFYRLQKLNEGKICFWLCFWNLQNRQKNYQKITGPRKFKLYTSNIKQYLPIFKLFMGFWLYFEKIYCRFLLEGYRRCLCSILYLKN